MKKRYLAVLLGMMVGVNALGGCAATPESSLVKQKGESAMKNYKSADDTAESTSGDAADDESVDMVSADESDSSEESGAASADGTASGGNTAENTGNTSDTADSTASTALPAEEGSMAGTGNAALRERLGAPETYQSEETDDTGKLNVTIDAKVLLPDAEKLNTITVTQHTFDQTAIDTITEAFFSGGTIYDATKYGTSTKSEIQAELDKLNGYLAEGNLDPFNYGTDEDGNYYFDIYAAIEENQTLLETAPEERVLEEVTPQFGLSYTEGDSTYTNDDYFCGIVEMSDGSRYVYQFQRYDSTPMEIKISRLESNETTNSDGYWSSYDGLKSTFSDVPGEQELKQEIGISLEEAKAEADEKVQALGLADMELGGWEYQVKWAEEASDTGEASNYSRDRQQSAGYLLHYTRKIDGVPVTFNDTYGGGLESMDSETETWCYERLDIIISSRGVEMVEFINQYDIGDVQTENVELLPFSDIIQTYEKMMLVQNADVLSYASSYSYTIDRIELGYGRIYEPSTDSRTGLLVPVWTFFGNVASTYPGNDGEEISYDTDEGPFYTTLCLNAVDGSVIDLSLGY